MCEYKQSNHGYYLFAFCNSRRQRINVDGYTKLVPVLNVRNVGSIEAVELNDQGIFACLSSFLTFVVVTNLCEEVAQPLNSSATPRRSSYVKSGYFEKKADIAYKSCSGFCRRYWDGCRMFFFFTTERKYEMSYMSGLQ